MRITRVLAVALLLTATLLGCAGGQKQAERAAQLQVYLDREAEAVYGVGSHRDEVRARIERPHRSFDLATLAPAGSPDRAEQDRLRAVAERRQWRAAAADRYPRVTSLGRTLLFVEDDVFYGADERVLGVASTVVDSEPPR